MDESLWPELSRALLPAEDEVLLISASLELPPERIAALRATFPPGELKRADRFATEELRNHWTAGRGLLRELLAATLGGEAAAIRFSYAEHGKPGLLEASAPALHGPKLTFNVSHSGGRALYALGRGREVGVDLEAMRGRRTDALAQRYYAPAESAALRAIPGDSDRQLSFFYVWSAKEAFIKATGAGLSQSLSSFSFALAQIPPPAGFASTPELNPDGRAPAQLLAPVSVLEHRGDPMAHQRWSVHPLAPAPGFSGALVAEGPVRALVLRSWDPRHARLGPLSPPG